MVYVDEQAIKRNEKFEELREYKFQKLGTNECSFLVTIKESSSVSFKFWFI